MTPLFQEKEDLITRRREGVFLLLSGLFLGSLVMLNILGVSKFIDLSFEINEFKVPFVLAVGVLPYPITFLCTDLISELFGKRRANLIVIVGLILNIWLLFILWIGGLLPPNVTEEMINSEAHFKGEVFYNIRMLAFSTTFASMFSYLLAQFADVHIFHWIKKKTKGKYLWLRNNGSTMVSQLIDSSAVILITFYLSKDALPIDETENLSLQLTYLILSSYVFKFIVAILDTIPFIFGTKFLKSYLRMN